MQRSTRLSPHPVGDRKARNRVGLIVAIAVVASALFAPGIAEAATTGTTSDQWGGAYGPAGSTSTNAGEHILTASNAGKIRQAYVAEGRNDGAYPPVVLGGVAYSVGGGTSPRFYASSPKTGKALWSMAMPYALSSYGFGMTGQGSTVMISFRTTPAGGVIAVNTARHSIKWRAFLPPVTTSNGDDRTYPGLPTTDGKRVFLTGSSNSVNTYSVATGKFLWSHPFTSNGNGGIDPVTGFAAGGGYFYTSGGQGLVAYSATTGKKAWAGRPSLSYGVPVLAGGRVFVNTVDMISAFPASGCGTSSCTPLWSTPVDSFDYDFIGIAGADSSRLFISYRSECSYGATPCEGAFVGHVARLSASTGRVQWQTTVGQYTQGIVRGGNLIWLVAEYSDSQHPSEQYRLMAYSVTATGTTPLASVPIASAYFGYPQSLSVASGTVFETPNDYALVGYRVPGT